MSKFKVGDVVMRVKPPFNGFPTNMKVGDVAVVTNLTHSEIYLDKFPSLGHDPEALDLVLSSFENI